MTILCLGMSTLDILVQGYEEPPRPGTTVFAERVGMSVGGDAVNQAIALTRLGHDVQLGTVVGDDAAGAFVRTALGEARVDIRPVAVDPTLSTTTSVVLIDVEGERSFISAHGGSSDRYGAAHVQRDQFSHDVEVLSIGSLLVSKEFDLDVLPDLLDWAHERGALTIADMVTDHPDVTLDDLSEVLKRLDYLVPSEGESMHYTGKVDPRAAADVFASYGVGATVIKRGSRGAVAVQGSDEVHTSTFVVPVVDTTGSGDSFVAGFVSGLASALPLQQCLDRAAATAAISVQGLGATTNIRSLDQVDDLIARGQRRTLVTS